MNDATYQLAARFRITHQRSLVIQHANRFFRLTTLHYYDQFRSLNKSFPGIRIFDEYSGRRGGKIRVAFVNFSKA